jgi:uncharacterized protein YcnI
MPPRVSAFRRLSAAAVAAGALVVGLPATASAHVTVRPDTDVPGAFAKLTFRVPTESDTAGTTGLRVRLPDDAPFAFVSVRPRPGWTVEVTREQLPEPVEAGDYTLDEVVTAVTWTATGGVRIGPGEFDEFEISVGPLPGEPGTYAFPTEQTYDDGEVVAWDELPPEDDGAEEPEHPAPTIEVAEPDDTGDAGDAHDTASTDEARETDDAEDGVARALGAGGLLAGVAGVGVAAASRRRSRDHG